MKLVRVASFALNQTPLDWPGNLANMKKALAMAREARATVVCLPELCITGYGCEDAFHAPGLHDQSLLILREFAEETKGLIVGLGMPLFCNRGLYDVAALCVDARIAGFAAKQFLAGDGVHYEPRWFKPWPPDHVATVQVGNDTVPVGDLLFECGGIKIGFEICEDAWVAKRPGSGLALRGADIVLNPSGSHFAFGKHKVRERFVVEGSRAFGVTYVYANLLGNESGRIIYDGGTLIASGGELLAQGKRFGFSDVEMCWADADITRGRMMQSRVGSFAPDVDDKAVEFSFNYPALAPEAMTSSDGKNTGPNWENAAELKAEEFARAVALGLFDYLRKSRSHGFVVSLSGGADSAAVSCLVAVMAHLAIAELGIAGVKQKLSYIDLKEVDSAQALINRLLTCVYQSTANSGEVTRNAARDVAMALGAKFLQLDVDPMVNGYRAIVEKALGKTLSWQHDDIALQNVQARSRGPSVWLLANLQNALLLATSNRSEVAVGYATMDGDTCGGLSPVAGIDKAYLRSWLRILEKHGVAQTPAISALSAVNMQAPTAELRPKESKQTDEADLMPYDILEAIEDAAIRDHNLPYEVFQLLNARFPDVPRSLLVTYVERFFTLFCRNQWKRERYAPSFHLDDRNLDPRSWCRFPILSSGYAQELQELRTKVLAEKS